MNMNLHVSPERGFLCARMSGGFSLPEAKETFLHILQAVSQHGLRRVLMDCLAMEGTLDTGERYEYAEFVSEQVQAFSRRGVSRATQFAYVVVPPLADPNRFGETVGLNRGVNVRLFHALDDALGWLGLDPSDVPVPATSSAHPAAER